MSRVLKHNVFLQRNPPSGEVTSLLAGDTLPEWAEGKVGNHLFEDARGAKPPKEVERKLPVYEEPVPEQEEETPVPTAKAGVAAWRKFAKAGGVTVPERATRNEIIELVLASNPDLEIPEA